MKVKVFSFLCVTSCMYCSLFGEILEVWDFEYPDQTPLTQVKSNLGTGFLPGGSPIMTIRNNELEFSYDGSTQHTFRQTAFSGEPSSTGISEISWVFTKVDFSRTAAASGSANVGLEVRDFKGTRQNNKDDLVLAGLRLRYDKGKLLIQYKAHDASNFEVIDTTPGAKFEAPVKVRIRLDLDNPTTAGALKIFLKKGTEEAFCALANGTLPESAVISGFRTAQQTINGKNSWQVGDVVCVDDFTRSAD